MARRGLGGEPERGEQVPHRVWLGHRPEDPARASAARTDEDVRPPLDLVLVPGGIGSARQVDNGALLDFLRARTQSAEITMSVCTGSAILARAGLLDGRRATSNKQLFKHATVQSDRVRWVPEARWVEDGPYVTSSGSPRAPTWPWL